MKLSNPNTAMLSRIRTCRRCRVNYTIDSLREDGIVKTAQAPLWALTWCSEKHFNEDANEIAQGGIDG